MPHALLLSPDDQAVSAINAVLEEMSVTCERPLDGPSAAKKLNSQSFDLVLVDCENLPAAKLIFDVCRRSQTGTNPVPIAIVDGRAGLPTAFRLGAELILTKPVAKDQARTTIRTAVSRVKKEDLPKTIHPFEEPRVEAAHPAAADTLTHAAAAGAAVSPASSPIAAVATASTANAATSSVVEETPVAAAAPKAIYKVATPTAPSIPATDMFLPAGKTAPEKASDDPVLADLESDSPTPVFNAYIEPKKSSAGLTTLLVLILAGGGCYAAWTYSPEFRETAQTGIDQVMSKVAQWRGTQAIPAAAQPVQVQPAANTPATRPVPQPPADAASEGSNAAPATSGLTSSQTPDPGTAAPSQAAVSATSTSSVEKGATHTDAAHGETAHAETKPSISSEPVFEAALPGERSAVILSSQGAEKRLIRHVEPAYPAEARKAGIEGTVVLKTVVNTNGTVDGVRVVEGNPTLAAAAVTSVKQWRYRPYVRDGKPQTFQTIVLVEFQRP